MSKGRIVYPSWWRCRWNRLRGKREVFYTMEFGATRMNNGVVEILTESDDDYRWIDAFAPEPVKAKTFPEWLDETSALLEECAEKKT